MGRLKDEVKRERDKLAQAQAEIQDIQRHRWGGWGPRHGSRYRTSRGIGGAGGGPGTGRDTGHPEA